MVGYDGGRVAAGAPGRPRGRHALRAHPAHPGGAGQRLPRAARAGRGRAGAVSADGPALRRVRARVEGTVQGVGFRPFVYRLAARAGARAAACCNDARGVLLEVEGEPAAVDALPGRGWRRRRRRWRAVERVAARGAARRAASAGFAIVESAGAAGAARRWWPPTRRPARTAWPSCCDPADRRYRYPFVNCTNCGPRFTIVRGVPYDRPLTTMAGFAMCAACRAEYEDPADRRFHAQPNACPDCGPAGAGCEPAATRRPARRGGGGRAAAAARSWRSRGSAATTSPAGPTTRRRSPRCGRASTARTSRSR